MYPEASLDLVKEFRLRAWARRNHVPADDRRSTWHPIVLDEMSRRDEELRLESLVTRPMADAEVVLARPPAMFVPLDPGPYHRRVDAPHEAVAAPNLAIASLRARIRNRLDVAFAE